MADLPPLPLELRDDHVPVTCHAARDAEIRAAILRAKRSLGRPEPRSPEPIIGFHNEDVLMVLDESTDWQVEVLGKFP